MLNRLAKFWDSLQGSYWFIPSLMAVGAFLLAHVLTANNQYLQNTYAQYLQWLYLSKPEGARILLSTIAGSMITVAGVTFSITIASVAYATTQYGPRLLTNFMEDRGNQFTLGTFIATFLYCLLVLRTIANADVPTLQPGDAGVTGAFVPHIAVAFGVLLGIASICVLIYFIHHVPASIHASNVIADIGASLIDRIKVIYPNSLQPAADTQESTDYAELVVDKIDIQASQSIESSGNGYLQFLDLDYLHNIACDIDGTIVVNCRPGDYLSQSSCLGWTITPDAANTLAAPDLDKAFIIGTKRTPAQDILFLSNELVEIAVRALSPGINDPFTAMDCMDWLSSACRCLATRRVDKPDYLDEDGTLRLLYRQVDFTEFTQTTYTRLSAYAATDRNAALHFLTTIGRVVISCPLQSQRQTLLSLLTPMLERAKQQHCEGDVKELQRRKAILEGIAASPMLVNRHLLREHWLAGGT
ncbi:DUF2254 domain-containing protein [Exilibacterium tricleocarpae]|uniref:DUF2254 domain-containing protein n=1 Tax=Exilibacterium tricleocarpae TaxID=2591008 RepID=A0A545TNL1_9GAMM|nr:DUF2254 domain-containing protein [Exilibacterium tricleocarpae]TQV78804.1 DUF2254 domain-containing protein [Exilibacterium tricleocarpae]